jgi:uncharacterized protein
MSQGVVRRKDKEMSRADAEALLARAALAHFGTVGADGTPYVVPNLFVHADGEVLLHTTAAAGHFRRNIDANPRVSIAATEMGQVFPYGRFECDTTVSYASVIAAGTIRIEPDAAEKARFFDRFLAKYADPGWARPKSFYPRLDEVTVYRIALERITGKKGPLLPMGEQWPARDNSKSPGAVPPRRD